MSIPVLTTAMLLAGAQLGSGEGVFAVAAPPVVPTLTGQGRHAPLPITPPASSNTVEIPSPARADQNEIVVEGRHTPPPGDPLEQINAKSYAITQDVDKAVVAPVARTYSKTIPAPVRSGLRNFFNNLAEPVVFLNYLIQIKPGKAAETFGRFAINTTIGGAGLFDMAKRRPFKLPLRRNGFANSMGYYGIKPGPFLYLPLVGPTTVRDLLGLWMDKLVLPVAVGKPFNQAYYTIPATIIGSLDYRVEYDAMLRKQNEDPDPYAAARKNYLDGRQAEIDALHGKHSLVPPPAADVIPPGGGPLVQPTLPSTPGFEDALPPSPAPAGQDQPSAAPQEE
ncbi:MAG TPA: VacJ family lipoprotein [Sphingobium sp.]